MIAREICRRVSPATFGNNSVVDNRNYASMLRETLDWVNTGGIPVIMTPGRYNAAYFEHSYLAERTGSELAACTDCLWRIIISITGITGGKSRKWA